MTRILVGPIFLIVFLLALAAPSVEGQVNSYLDATGVPTFTTAMPVEAGFINLANGNMHLEIPIASYPQRGKTSYSARMAFDSRVWKINPTAINGGPQWQPSGGWSLTAGPGGGSATYTYNQANPVCQKGVNRYQTTKYQGFYWQETNGTYHNFLITLTNNYACPQNNVASAAAYATDNSGYYMSVVNYGQTITVKAKDGTQVYPTLEDTNGNYISSDGNGNGIDTLQRTPITESGSFSNCNPFCSITYL